MKPLHKRGKTGGGQLTFVDELTYFLYSDLRALKTQQYGGFHE